MVVEIAMQYTSSYTENVYSFANNINTHEGGTHIIGFKTALTRVANDYIKANKLSKEDIKLTGDDVREGLTAIISVKLMEPQFEGQTKTKLGNSDVKGIVDSLVTDGLAEYFEENPKVANVILEKALLAQKAREAAKKARELTRRILQPARFTLWKVIRQAVRQNRVETGVFRLFYLSEARS